MWATLFYGLPKKKKLYLDILTKQALINQRKPKSRSKYFGLRSSIMDGKDVRHPTLPIQRIVRYFNFNSNINFLVKKFRYLGLV